MALTLAPKDSATPITNEECTSLKNNTGLAVGDNKNNCEASTLTYFHLSNKNLMRLNMAISLSS